MHVLDVGSSDERSLSCPSEDDRTNIGVRAELIEEISEFAKMLEVECIERLRAIDRYKTGSPDVFEIDRHEASGRLHRHPLTDELDDLRDRRTRSEDLRHAELTESVSVLSGNRAADDYEHIVQAVFSEAVDDPGDERHMRTGEDRDADRVCVLLKGGLNDLLGRLVEARIDDLHAGVPQRPCDDLCPAVVAVEAGLRDHDADLSRHSRQYMEVRLTVIGSSPAWPNPGSAQSGYLVEGPGRLLLDCGPGVLAMLRENGLVEIDAIAITHFHLDHWGDLVPWVWLRTYGVAADGRKPELWLPPGGQSELASFADRFGSRAMFESCFQVTEYEVATDFEAAGFQVVAAKLEHYTVDAYGFRVSHADRTLAYSGDAAPSEALADLAHGADLFLVEATLARGELDGQPRGHLSADEAIAAADGPVLLTHRPVELEAPEGIAVARDGLVVEI